MIGGPASPPLLPRVVEQGGAVLPVIAIPTISVVIATLNRAATLRLRLQPLLDDVACTEVVVIDDGSTDGTADVLRQFASEHSKLRWQRQSNKGCLEARKAGVALATGEVVLLLDDDVQVAPGLAAAHALKHQDRDDVVIMGYMPVHSPDRAFSAMIYALEYEHHCRQLEEHPEQAINGLWFGNLSLRRNRCLAVGMTPAAVPRSTGRWSYHEDTEFGLRCRQAGLIAEFDRRLSSVHHYERPLSAWRRDARGLGRSVIALHQVHSAQLGERTPADLDRHLPSLLRLLVRATDGALLRVLVEKLLVTAILSLRAVGLECSAPQLAAARLLRRIETRRGARQEWALWRD